MKRAALISLILLLLMGTMLTGCGTPAAKQGQMVLTITVPSGPSVYPGLPWPSLRSPIGHREIPAGTAYIDIVIDSPSYGRRDTIAINPSTSAYSYSITLPVGSGYTVEIAATDSTDTESLTSGFASNVVISAGTTTQLNIHLQRLQFTLSSQIAANMSGGGNLSFTGKITTPWNLAASGVKNITAIFQNTADPTDRFTLSMAGTLPAFPSATATSVSFTGKAPSVTTTKNYECHAIGIGYTHTETDHSWTFVYSQTTAIVATQIIPANLIVTID